MKHLLLFFFLLILQADVMYARTADHSENSILWEISKKGLKHKSYLLGTFHGDDSIKIGYQYIDSLPRFHDVMNNVDAIGLEFDFGDSIVFKFTANKIANCISGKYPEYAYLPDSIKSLESVFQDSIKYQYVEQFLRKFKRQKYVKPFRHERLKPCYINVLIKEWEVIAKQIKVHKEGGGPVGTVMDEGIYQLAKEKGKRIIGLSPAAYELNITEAADSCAVVSDNLTEQANILYDICRIESGDSVDVTTINYTNELIELYKQENLSKMHSENKAHQEFLKNVFLEEEKNLDDFFKELLLVRNTNWTKRIIEEVQDCSCLFAVGALHLPGENGLINMLRNEGYTLRPVDIQSKEALQISAKRKKPTK